MKRNTYFDFLRGIAIIMVVGIHTWHQGSHIEIRQVLNAAVPIFIAISGFFLAQKDVSNIPNYTTFLKKQVARVYIPTLLWSFPLFALSLYSSGKFVSPLLNLLICGFSIYYFIAFIIQCYITLPVVKRVSTHIRGGNSERCIFHCMDRFNYMLDSN